MQFILQLKLCLYTTVHHLLDKFKKTSLKSSLSTPSLCHKISPGVGVKRLILGPESSPSILVPESESEFLYFLTLDSESESNTKKQGLHISNLTVNELRMQRHIVLT